MAATLPYFTFLTEAFNSPLSDIVKQIIIDIYINCDTPRPAIEPVAIRFHNILNFSQIFTSKWVTLPFGGIMFTGALRLSIFEGMLFLTGCYSVLVV